MKGVLLVNLGTPDSPKPWDVFRYLNEFLTDERVVDFPWLKRQLLVRGLIVPLRFRASAKSYQAIWTKEGSPLRTHTDAAAVKLQEKLGSEWKVETAMRYQNPSIPKVLRKMKGVEELIVIPLFPQYASATTGSVIEKVMKEIQTWDVIPKIKIIDSFFDLDEVITSFAAQAESYDLKTYDKVLFSFHGLPVRQLTKVHSHCQKKSDCCKKTRSCYSAQCYQTADLLAKKLNLKSNEWEICFQSRLGKEPWMQPYTSDTLTRLGKQGSKKLLVFCPAFVADCLETIHEIGVEYAEEFRHLGGETLDLVPSLNSSDSWIYALEKMVKE